MDWWIDLLTTCIHHSKLHFTDRWHTQTSGHSLLQSPLAVFWQQLPQTEILQLPVLRSSCHSRPCRTLCEPTTQLTGPQAGGHSTSTSESSLHRLTFNWQLNILTHQQVTSHNFTQLNCWQLNYLEINWPCLKHFGTNHIENTVSVIIVQPYLDRCLEMCVGLLAYCIATAVVYRVTA
jgi:hypothetical protein